MAEFRYLGPTDVVDLHDLVLYEDGATQSPLLHPGGLESALNRARNAAYYEGADIVRQAILMAVGISQSQAFMDGNKRTALAVSVVFLQTNGFRFRGDRMEWARRIEGIAEAPRGPDRDAAEAEFETWLRDRVSSVTP